MQRPVADKDVGRAASIAAHYMDVVTTSGRATGEAASIQKIAQMRAECSNVAMALASGVTPTNAASYLPFVDCFMVATGVSPPGDFYNFDPLQLRALVHVSRSADISSDSWYLSLIAPNTKGRKFAWLDPSSIYIDARAFSELAQDLLAQFNPRDFDLVVGIDAMGFPLAAAMAIKAGKVFSLAQLRDEIKVHLFGFHWLISFTLLQARASINTPYLFHTGKSFHKHTHVFIQARGSQRAINTHIPIHTGKGFPASHTHTCHTYFIQARGS